MTLKDFVKQYVEHNSLIRVVYKLPGGHKAVLNRWSEVSMDHELLKMKGKFAKFANHEVIGVASILTTGSYPDAVNIVVKEIPEDVLRDNKLEELGI
jgi:hypothetical protein